MCVNNMASVVNLNKVVYLICSMRGRDAWVDVFNNKDDPISLATVEPAVVFSEEAAETDMQRYQLLEKAAFRELVNMITETEKTAVATHFHPLRSCCVEGKWNRDKSLDRLQCCGEWGTWLAFFREQHYTPVFVVDEKDIDISQEVAKKQELARSLGQKPRQMSDEKKQIYLEGIGEMAEWLVRGKKEEPSTLDLNGCYACDVTSADDCDEIRCAMRDANIFSETIPNHGQSEVR